ncbi:hypothetical protein [Halobacillus litoralis]|uniref:hypothetical protein n=1 Tax=Halobacillus litoralis TaxID=45668 RepID=UPI00249141AA|nr:hypothetical protein [Halobacillus litoralis]
MNKEMENRVEEAEIPNILKDYFLRNTHIHLYLNDLLLNEIEEIYIEYDSLYEFDDAEFCSYVITGVKKQEKHEYFYHYLKKVLDSNLELIPKSRISDYQKLTKLGKNISNLQEDEILIALKNLLITMQDLKVTKKQEKLLQAYKLTGALQVLFTLYPDNVYKKDFEHIFLILESIDI